MGTLNFYPNGTVEFKSINCKTDRKQNTVDDAKKVRDTSKEANIKSLLRTD